MTREERSASYERHYRAVARFIRSRGHEPADADDLIARTFEVAWREPDKLPEGRAALPWLLTVARNLSRTARSNCEASSVDAMWATTVPGVALSFADPAAGTEVGAALARLKPVDRDLILLVVWDELTPSEAGRVLGLLPVTARSRLRRARRRLSALLQGSTASTSGAIPAWPPTTMSSEGATHGG